VRIDDQTRIAEEETQMRYSSIWFVLSIGLLLYPAAALAQQENNDTLPRAVSGLGDRVGGLDERLSVVETDVANLKKLKISGYVQARYEYHDDAVSQTPTGTTSGQGKLLNRFFIRRGRLKATYQASAQALGVVYIDASASGVSLKEAYASLTEPRTQLVATLGQFNWLFGYEISFSSSKREFPERTRWSRLLFPGERDRGIKLERQFLIENQYSLNLQAGVYNGNGIDDKSFGAYDPNKYKDFVARASAGLGFLDFGISGYWGRQFNPTESGSSLPASTTDKVRYGVDGQLFYEVPSLGGGVLKAEAVIAKEPKDQSKPYQTGTATRDVLGLDLVWAQNLRERLQLISRLDYYDPDRDIERDCFVTYGIGLVYFWDGNSKVKLAYEIPRAAQHSLSGRVATATGTEDERDNILTLEWVYTF
jgi:hypothetical protein